MTITSSLPSSGSIVQTGTTFVVTNNIGTAVDTITYHRTGSGGASEVVWTTGGGYQAGYTGGRSLAGSDETFTFKRLGAGWDDTPFQLEFTQGGGSETLAFTLVAEGQYPPDMQPFNDPQGEIAVLVEDSGVPVGGATTLDFNDNLGVTDLGGGVMQIDGSAAGGGSGDVTSAATLANNAMVRGDGGAKGVQDSVIIISDLGVMTGVETVSAGTSVTAPTLSADDKINIHEVSVAPPTVPASSALWVQDGAFQVLMWTDDQGTDHDLLASGTGDVSAAAAIADNALVRGDGGSKGVQQSGITISDADVMNGVTTVSASLSVTAPTLYADEKITIHEVGTGPPTVPAQSAIWVQDGTTQALMWTDDQSTDYNLTLGGSQSLDNVITSAGGGTVDNSVAVPDADPVILFNTTGSFPALTVSRLAASATVPALEVTSAATGLVAKLGDWNVTDAELKTTNNAASINATTDSGAPSSFDIYGIGTTTQDVDGGDLRLRGGSASNATSSGTGGNCEIDGGFPLIGGADGSVLIGVQAASEIRLGKGLTVGETASRPVTPIAGRGQFWVRTSDGKPVFTDGSAAEYDLTAGSGHAFSIYDSVDSVGTPGVGQAFFNASTYGSATEIKIDRYDQDGARIAGTWGRLGNGDSIVIAEQADRSVGGSYTVSSVTTSSNHYIVTVVAEDTNGSVGGLVEIWPVATKDVGGGSAIVVTDEGGAPLTSDVASFDFVGGGVTATNSGDDVTITIAAGGAPIDTVFGRTGTVFAAASDYDASQVDNDSSVSGTFVDDALNTLDTDIGVISAIVVDDETIVLSQTNPSEISPADNTIGAGPATLFHSGDSSSGIGGALTVRGGDSSSNVGGDLTVRAGDAASGVVVGGDLIVRGGNSAAGDGGDLKLDAGLNSSGGTDGSVLIGSSGGDVQIGSSGPGSGNTSIGSDSMSVDEGVIELGIGVGTAQITPGSRTAVAGTEVTIAGGATTDASAGGDLTLEGGNSTSGTDGDVNIGIANTTAVNVGVAMDVTGNITQAGTAVVLSAGTVVDEDIVVFDGTTGTPIKKLSGVTSAAVLASTAHADDITTNPHDVDLAGLGPGVHSNLEQASVDSGTIFASLQTGQVASLTSVAAAVGQFVPVESSGGVWQNVDMADLLAEAAEVNDLATDGIAGIADNQLAVGTGSGTAGYATLPTTGAVAFNGTAFAQAALADLSDVTTPTGTGEPVLAGSPTITTPTIASFANSQHDHADAAGGGTIAYADITGTPTIPSAPTLTKSITVEDPVTGETISMFYTNVAITVTQVTAVIVGATSVTFNISHGTSRAAVTNDVMVADDVADSTTTGNITTTFTSGDPTIPADSFVALTTSAATGTPTELHVTVEYTED